MKSPANSFTQIDDPDTLGQQAFDGKNQYYMSHLSVENS